MSKAYILDASAKTIDLQQTEGDPLAFQWTAKGAASWAGSYVFSIGVDDGPFSFDVTVNAVDTDALFSISHGPIDTLTASASGWPWKIKQVDGLTRFGGLLYVVPARC